MFPKYTSDIIMASYSTLEEKFSSKEQFFEEKIIQEKGENRKTFIRKIYGGKRANKHRILTHLHTVHQ